VAATVDPADSFEVRFGVFSHGVGSVERGTFDLNAEVVSPRLSFGASGPWAVLIPRLHVGGSINLDDRTNFGYAGLLWTVPLLDRLFAEGFVGAAVHDGSRTPTARLSGLGCDTVFHAGASLGYRLSPRWSVIATFEHLSNGRTIFGIRCGNNLAAGGNQGLNNYGLRVGYSF
jgi:lipid A 3-O-deacylase